MDITGGEYEKMTKKASPPSKKVRNGCFAFLIGGLICVIGEGCPCSMRSSGWALTM